MSLKSTLERRGEMLHLREIGLTYQQIADRFEISRQRVHQILGGVEVYMKKKANRNRRREYLIHRLGGKCVRCGFSDPRALQIDHIAGGGCREFRTIGNVKLLKLMVDMPEAEFRRKYQLLCANCNWIKRCENHEV